VGQGQLDARARVGRFSDIKPLVADFNAMAERLELLVSQQRALINGVAHELRTPIARLGFGIDLLNESSASPAHQKRTQSMRDDLLELDALISEMLSYARLQQVGEPRHLEWVSVEPWLASVMGAVTLEAQKRGIQLHTQTGAITAWPMDPRLMARAMLNLLRNALRYARTQVLVCAFEEGHNACLLVQDDGPGIPPESRQRVFEPFARLDDSRSRDSGGFGLGLAIVRQIALSHEGRAAVSQARLGGACFALTWPLKEAQTPTI
jgi:two-component system sensor kinase ParS